MFTTPCTWERSLVKLTLPLIASSLHTGSWILKLCKARDIWLGAGKKIAIAYFQICGWGQHWKETHTRTWIPFLTVPQSGNRGNIKNLWFSIIVSQVPVTEAKNGSACLGRNLEMRAVLCSSLSTCTSYPSSPSLKFSFLSFLLFASSPTSLDFTQT